MYTPAFHYHRAQSLADAHRLLAAHPGAKVLAGGHSLIPMLKLRLASMPTLVDIGRVAELRGVSRMGDQIRIGALTTHAEIAGSDDLRTHAPAMWDAANVLGDPAVRNRGTIGGNIAHADPASDLPTVLVALNATVIATGPAGERSIPADQFFRGIMSTALNDDEIITAVTMPADATTRASAYVKFAHPASRYAVVGAAAAVSMSGGKCTGARVAIGGLVPHAMRLPAVEQALAATSGDAAAIRAAADNTKTSLGEDVSGDIFASAEYRAAVAPVYVARAIAAAVARAGAA
jgi:carbon-monoxide dehydrogenase medium subunit